MDICNVTYYSVQKLGYNTSTSMAVKSIFKCEALLRLAISARAFILHHEGIIFCIELPPLGPSLQTFYGVWDYSYSCANKLDRTYRPTNRRGRKAHNPDNAQALGTIWSCNEHDLRILTNIFIQQWTLKKSSFRLDRTSKIKQTFSERKNCIVLGFSNCNFMKHFYTSNIEKVT